MGSLGDHFGVSGGVSHPCSLPNGGEAQAAEGPRTQRGPGHGQFYPKSKDVLEECGMSTLAGYITVCWQMIAVYVATHPDLIEFRQGK